MKKTKSVAKQRLIEFLTESKLDEEYTMYMDIDIIYAQDFVHRMRVELSRLRDLARKKSKVPKHFKMLFVRAVETQGGKCAITLKKSLSANNVDNEVNDILDLVAAGDRIDA